MVRFKPLSPCPGPGPGRRCGDRAFVETGVRAGCRQAQAREATKGASVGAPSTAQDRPLTTQALIKRRPQESA
jgi:hypothetical protein